MNNTKPRKGRYGEFNDRVTVAVYVEAEEKEALQDVAGARGVPISAYVRRLIVADIEDKTCEQ